MKHLEQVYIRLSDGLILFPIQGNDSELFNHRYPDDDDIPVTKNEMKELGFVMLKDLINKPVETTNEQPYDHTNDLKELYKNQKNIQYPILYQLNDGIEVQLTGISISLKNDGTFFINDTSGG